MSDWEVGQKVILRDTNGDRHWWPDGEPPTGTITKVGRTLLHVTNDQWPTWKPETYRIEDGTCNDNYGHAWIQTLEAFRDEAQRGILLARIRKTGVNLSGVQKLTLDQLGRIADIVEEAP